MNRISKWFCSVVTVLILSLMFTLPIAAAPQSSCDNKSNKIDVTNVFRGIVTTTIFETDPTVDVPAGYERVSVHPKSDAKGLALWVQTYGTTEGYSLEAANRITVLTPIGAVPCGCHMPQAPYRYVRLTKDSPPSCEDTCSPSKTTMDLSWLN